MSTLVQPILIYEKLRDALLQLIQGTIVHQYDLPNAGKSIEKTILSTVNDNCYSSVNKDNLCKIIYNAILEYSHNEFDLSADNEEAQFEIALRSRIRFDDTADIATQLKYGFFGEVLLYAALFSIYQANPIISRGYFYNPLENSETKGYDSYHLVETSGTGQLWFGEVKFHKGYVGAVNSALNNIENAISDEYLERNIIAMNNHKHNFNVEGSSIEIVLNDWSVNPAIRIKDHLIKHNLELIYPVFIMYEKHKDGYDKSIEDVVDYITKNHSNKSFQISIPYSIFFILMPVEGVIEIKNQVLQWIDSKEPLL